MLNLLMLHLLPQSCLLRFLKGRGDHELEVLWNSFQLRLHQSQNNLQLILLAKKKNKSIAPSSKLCLSSFKFEYDKTSHYIVNKAQTMPLSFVLYSILKSITVKLILESFLESTYNTTSEHSNHDSRNVDADKDFFGDIRNYTYPKYYG